MRPLASLDARFCFFAALLVAGCQTTPVRPVESKPEHLNISAYRSVIIERAEGEYGTIVGTELTRQLRETSRYQPDAKQDSAVDLSAALTSDYQERIEQRPAPCLVENGYRTCRSYTRIGTLTVQGVLRVMDPHSGTVSGELSTSCDLVAQKSAVEEMPPSLDVHALAYGCAAEIVRDFEQHSQPGQVH